MGSAVRCDATRRGRVAGRESAPFSLASRRVASRPVPSRHSDVRGANSLFSSRPGEVSFTVMVHRGTGNFEVCNQGVAVAIGRVAFFDANEERSTLPPLQEVAAPDSSDLPLTSVDVYKELRLRGYHYSGLFQGISRASLDGKAARSSTNGIGVLARVQSFSSFFN